MCTANAPGPVGRALWKSGPEELPWVGGIVGFAQDMAGALGFSSMLEKPLQNIFWSLPLG